MKKRILSFTLVLTMLCSLLTTVPVSASSTFSDINGHWAKATIEELADKGVVNGKEDGKYDPEGKVTRAEISKLLVCTVEDEFENADGELTDVPEDAWFNPYVYEALNRSLFFLNELNGDSFMPNESADRETVAVWAMRLLGVEGEDETTPFVDNGSITNKKAVATAYNYGIMTGDEGKNTFRPKDTLTRAEAAIVIKKVMDKYQEMHSVRPSENVVEYKDDVFEVDGDGSVNKLESYDEKQNKYVFSNIDDSIKNLQVGDVFIVDSCDLIPGGIAIKVKTINVSGTTATIYGDDNIAADEVLEKIDIAEETALTFDNIESFSLAEGVTAVNENGETFAMVKERQENDTYLADTSDELLAQTFTTGNESLSFSLDEKMKYGTLTRKFTLERPKLQTDIDYGAIKGLKKLEVKVIWSETEDVKYSCKKSLSNGIGTGSIQKFDQDGNSLSELIKKHTKNGLSDVKDELTGENAGEVQEQKIAEMNVPIGTTPFIATVGIYLQIELTGEVSLSVKHTITTTAGFKYENDKFNPIFEKTNSVDLKADAQATLEAGIQIETSLSLLKVVSVSTGLGAGVGVTAKVNLLSAGLSGTASLEGLSGTATGNLVGVGGGSVTGEIGFDGIDGSYQLHRCRLCLDGDIYIYARITAKTTMGIGDKLSYTPFSKTINILNASNAKIRDFYISVHEKNNGIIDFDWGDCPHLYKSPSVEEQPSDTTVAVGEDAQFTTKGKNNAFKNDGWFESNDFEKGLTYQWYKDGVKLEGETSNTIKISNVTADDAGEYYCEIGLEEYQDLTKQTNKAKLIVDDSMGVSNSSYTGRVSEESKTSTFTYTAPKTGMYRLKNTIGEDVLIGVDGTYKVNEGEFELQGGKTYTVSIEWGIEDTDYAIEIEGLKATGSGE